MYRLIAEDDLFCSECLSQRGHTKSHTGCG